MAATSAGTYRSTGNTDIVPVSSSANIALSTCLSSSINNDISSTRISSTGSIQTNLQHQTLLDQKQFNLQEKKKLQYHNVVQYQNQHNLHHEQHTQFMPRVGNESIQHLELLKDSDNNCKNSVICQIYNTSNEISNEMLKSSTMICNTSLTGSDNAANTNKNSIILNQIHQPKQLDSIIQHLSLPVSSISDHSANLPKGWQRLISNNEIIYFSPSGESLRSYNQIKDYLLSPGTCKCGLPCPLRLEYFFDFNTQIPNTILKSQVENGTSVRTSSIVCMHQKRLYDENQKISLQKEIKRRKITDITTTTGGKISTSPITQCNSVAIYSDGNVMQTSQVVGNSSSGGNLIESNIHNRLTQQLVGQKQLQQQLPIQQLTRPNIAFQVQNHHQSQMQLIQQQSQSLDNSLQVKTNNNEKQIGCVTLSKTPPWRKHSILQQQTTGTLNNIVGQQQQLQQHTFIESGSNERVPPLPQAHLTPQIQSTIVPPPSTPPWQENSQNRLIKNKTNTITINNNTKKKPNFKDDPTGYLNQQTAILHNTIMNVVQNTDNDLNPTTQINKTQVATIRQDELQISGQKLTNNITINDNNLTNMIQQNSNLPSYQQQNVTNEIKNDKQETSIRKVYTNDQHIFQNHQQIRQIMQAPSLQNIITNVPSSQQINNTVKQRTKTVQRRQQQYQSPERIIGGQNVTTYSNNMVQMEQQPNNNNCDNNKNEIVITDGQIASSSSLKPQQQIQLQQQIRQQNILFRQNQQIQKTITASSSPSTNDNQLNSTEELLTKSNDNEILEQQQTKQHIKLKCPLTGQIILPSQTSYRQSQESPVSSSTTFNRLTPPTNKQFQTISVENNKGPAQVGSVSTSIESPRSAESPEYSVITIKRTTPPSSLASTPLNTIGSIVSQTTAMKKMKKPNLYGNPSQTLARNTITSVQAGTSGTINKSISITTTTSTSSTSPVTAIFDGRPPLMNKITIEPSSPSSSNRIIHHSQKLSPNNLIPVSNLQLQSIVREPGNQLIMTSTGQIIVMPTNQQPTKQSTANQVIINNSSNATVQNQNAMIMNKNQQQNLIINQSGQQHLNTNIQIHHQHQNSGNNSGGNNVVIQNSPTNLIQSPNHLIQQNQGTTNFIMNSNGNSIHQPTTMILNNGNIIHQPNGQNLLTTNTNATNLLQPNTNNSTTTSLIASGTKIISNQNILTTAASGGSGGPSNVHHQIINNTSNLLSPNGSNIIGQQAVVLNTLANGGYVIQHPQTSTNYATTVDGQVVQIQESGTFLQQSQQPQRHIIITSPDSNKRKAKKRKGSSSTSSSPSTPTSLSPQQSPTTILQHHPQIQTNQVVQISTPTHQYPTQQFQISPGIQGIMMNKNPTQTSAPPPHQQQILFQNGQIIQPVNLISGQQLLVPAGLVMAAPDTTLLQIQNMGMGSSIITTPQGMVLRTPSPQNKNFLSPSNAGQQFIVNSNGQMSPIGQIYSTPMSLMVPQSNNNTGTATFVQQNATIVQQQQQQQQQQTQQQAIQIQNQNANGIVTANQIIPTTNNQIMRGTSASPPDTTTHSPRSPERPSSQRSGGSDMVQCVSSSEPDSVVSPSNIDSAQSPTTTDSDRNITYQTTTTQIYKPTETKMRRIETPTQFTNQDIKPDSYESSYTNSASSTTKITKNITASTTSTRKNRIKNTSIILNHKTNSTISVTPTPTTTNSTTTIKNNGQFSIGELVWGDMELRRQCYWPGKIVNSPEGFCTPSDSTWVQWFGGRQNIELVAISSLKSLSEGLEAHHKAQKDTRKSRKLNSQLERAIQDAMTELDRMSNPQLSSNNSTISISPILSKTTKHHRTKPIKIAPAPPSVNNVQQLFGNQVSNQSQQIQQQHTSPSTTTK